MRRINKYYIIALIAALIIIPGVVGIITKSRAASNPRMEAAPDNCYGETLRVVTDKNYSPYSFVDGQGNMTGHDIEVITLIANEMNMNLEITSESWNEAVQDIVAGKYDILLTSDYFDDYEGSDTLLKTEPVSLDEFVVFSKKDIRSTNELYSKKIGVMENANVLPYLRMLNLEDRCVVFASNTDAMKAVEEGTVDCAIVRYTVGEDILNDLKLRDISSSLSIGNSYMCFIVRSGDTETLEKVNAAIEDLKERGELDRLSDKWLTTYVHEYTFSEMVSDNLWIIPLLVFLAIATVTLVFVDQRRKLKVETENSARIMSLEDNFESLYDVELSSGRYEHYVKGKIFVGVADKMTYGNRFLEDTKKNIDIVYPDDREYVLEILQPDNIRMALEKKTHFDSYYRIVAGGLPIWARMRIRYKDTSRHNVIIGVFNAEEEMASRLNAEQMRKEQIARMTGGVSSYILNPLTGKFVVLSQNEHLSANYPEVEDYTTSITRYIENDIYAPDRKEAREKLDLNTMVTNLGTRGEYRYQFRDISMGLPRWYELRAVRLSDNEILYGFTDKDDEIVRNIIFGKFEDEYYAIFYINLDSGMVEILKDKPGKIARSGDIIPYTPFMKDMAAKLGGEAGEYFKQNSDVEYLRERFRNSDKSTFLYKSTLSDGLRWSYITEVVLSRKDDGEPEFIAMGFTLLDAEAAEKEMLKLELEQARDEADAANKAKTQFLFNMSHDIRTPMNAITGFTTMAKKYIYDEDRVLDYLDKIDNSGQQLLSLINQVLEMARIESGELELREDPTDVSEEYEALMEVFTEQAKANGLEFIHNIVDVVHNRVLADRARMSSVTLNIIGNAMKYTPKGGKVNFTFKEITPRKEGYATFILISEDTGIGMSEEYLKVIFDPFTREKNSTVSHIQGTGLGMSIVKELVDVLGGEIKVESKVGEGTRFEVTVDFRIDTVDRVKEAEIIEENKHLLAGKKVLLVEDNDLNREIAIDYLEEAKLIVASAEDGTVAIQMVKDMGPDYYDLILMDIQMPVMDGFEATKKIREIYPDIKAPIIALSANAFAEDKAASIRAGMDDHVSKPINIDELNTVMAKHLKDHSEE